MKEGAGTSSYSYEEFVPASGLAELAYCPRNFYLRYVEGEKGENLYLVKGSLEESARARRKVRHRKGAVIRYEVPLVSEELGICGVVDAVVEEEDGEVVPLEYKSGKHKVRDSDRVQLCAYGLMLEEATGRRVDYGYLYYTASSSREKVHFSDELRERVKELASRARYIIESGDVPEGVDDERCEKCAMNEICLPLYRGKGGVKRVGVPRSLVGKVVYVDSPGRYLRKRGNRLVVTYEGEVEGEVPLVGVKQVIFTTSVNISERLLASLMARGVDVVMLTSSGRVLTYISGERSRRGALIRRQVFASADPDFRLDFARRVVNAKLRNMRFVLRERGVKGGLDELERLAEKALIAESLDEVRGIEGLGTRVYFGKFAGLVGGDFDFTRRNRRPPKDEVNALLSLGYTLLLKDVISAVRRVGLDETVGYFHELRRSRPSLALDLMEEWRPLLVDRMVLSVLHLGMVSPDDFERLYGGVFLKGRGRKKFYSEYERRVNVKIKHPVFDYKLEYWRQMEVQCRVLAAVLRGEMKEYVPFVLS